MNYIIRLTGSNSKKPIYVNANNIAFFEEGEVNKENDPYTAISMTNGEVVFVSEKPEEILNLLTTWILIV